MVARRAKEARVRMLSRLVGIVASQEEGPCGGRLTTASQVGSQDTTMVGAIGSYFDPFSVSEGIPELVGAPRVREGEFVHIEVDYIA